MPHLDVILQMIQSYGLAILVPFSVLEGPIVTVIAGYLAHLGYLNLIAVYLVCVAGDLVGDALLYAAGRYGAEALPPRVARWLGLSEARQIALIDHFAEKGGRTLLFGKWTHSAGMPILVAAGLSRMNFLHFLGFNLLGTLPKTLAFTLIGYYLGAAYSSIDGYIYNGSQILLALMILAGAGWLGWQGWRRLCR
ncbi:MAG: DedA family protein [Cypionkella sp.]|jgi:membrane protein DedA with SNARE-associated domain